MNVVPMQINFMDVLPYVVVLKARFDILEYMKVTNLCSMPIDHVIMAQATKGLSQRSKPHENNMISTWGPGNPVENMLRSVDFFNTSQHDFNRVGIRRIIRK